MNYLPQVFLCSKFEESVPAGYLEIELNANGEPRFAMFNDPGNTCRIPICITAEFS